MASQAEASQQAAARLRNKESLNVLEDLRTWIPDCPWPEAFRRTPIGVLHEWSREDCKEILDPVDAVNLYNLLHPPQAQQAQEAQELVAVEFFPVFGLSHKVKGVTVPKSCTLADLTAKFLEATKRFRHIAAAVRFWFVFNKLKIENDDGLRGALATKSPIVFGVAAHQKQFSKVFKEDIADHVTFNEELLQLGKSAVKREITSQIKKTVDDIKCDLDVFDPVVFSANEQTRREYISSVIKHVVQLFKSEGMKVRVERHLAGEIGRGPVDYILSCKGVEIFVTEAIAMDLQLGEYQNVAQLQAAHQARRKRKRTDDEDVEMFGAVTDAVTWVFIKLDKSGETYMKSKPMLAPRRDEGAAAAAAVDKYEGDIGWDEEEEEGEEEERGED